MKQLLLSVSLFFGILSASQATIFNISVSDFQFTPSSITVHTGDTVMFMWVNGDHTATSVNIPATAAPFDSPINSGNPMFMYVPTVAGTYAYTCVPHQSMNMNGVFTVLPATNVSNIEASLFSVYPNPASTQLIVALENTQPATAMLFDLAGRTMISKAVAGTATLDVANLSNGTYFLKLEQNGATAVETVVVAH